MTTQPPPPVPEVQNSMWGANVVMWIRENWALAVTAVGAASGVFIGAPVVLDFVASGFNWSALAWKDGVVCFLALVALTCVIVGPWAEAKKRKTKADLEEKIRSLVEAKNELERQIQSNADRRAGDAEHQLKHLGKLIRPQLQILLHGMEVWSEQCRVSAYRHDAETREFVKIARESSSPALMAAGRSRYPDDEGLIRRAWENGNCSQDITLVDEEKWISYQVNRGEISEATARAISMRARCYRGVRVRDDVTSEALGVLMFEHDTKNGLDSEPAANVLANIGDQPAFMAIRAYFAAMIPNQVRQLEAGHEDVPVSSGNVAVGATDFVSSASERAQMIS